jgi:hypothetical protein
MYGKAYVVMYENDIVEVSLSRQNAQEVLADYALDYGYYNFLYYLNYYGESVATALEAANDEMTAFRIWEFNLV